LEVDAVIVVPKLLTIRVISYTKEEGLVFQIRLLRQLDLKDEPISSIITFAPPDVTAILRGHLGDCLPIVESEPSNHVLLEGIIGDSHCTDKVLLVCG
jgi:hypothetical protein